MDIKTTNLCVIEEIYVTPDSRAALQSVRHATIVAGAGIDGDRYFLKRGTFTKDVEDADAGREVTLIWAEAIEAAIREHGAHLSHGKHRRNIVLRGSAPEDLAALIGKIIHIGEVQLHVDRTCPPCGHLNRVTELDTMLVLKNRGGLRTRVLTGGEVKVGDAVRFVTRTTVKQ